MAPSSNALV